jgi:hypothetical protein
MTYSIAATPGNSGASSITVSLPLLAAIALLAVGLTVADGILVARNRALQGELNRLMMTDLAPVGATLPTLSGKQPDGSPMEVDLAQSAPMLLFVFSPTCQVCEQNWPNWAKFIGDPDIGRQYLLLSAHRSIPATYLADHHAGTRVPLLGINPEIVRAFNLGATPQTLLVEKGRIVKAWPGVLSQSELKEIKNGLIDLSKAYH